MELEQQSYHNEDQQSYHMEDQQNEVSPYIKMEIKQEDYYNTNN